MLPIRHTGCTLCCGLFSSLDTPSLTELKYWNYLVHSSVILNSSCILQSKNEYEIQTCVTTTTTAMPVDAGLESHWRGLPWDFFILPIVQPIHRLNNKYSICICETMSHPIENKRKINTITSKIKFCFFSYIKEKCSIDPQMKDGCLCLCITFSFWWVRLDEIALPQHVAILWSFQWPNRSLSAFLQLCCSSARTWAQCHIFPHPTLVSEQSGLRSPSA